MIFGVLYSRNINDGGGGIIAGSRVLSRGKKQKEIHTRTNIGVCATGDPGPSRRRQPPLPNRQLDRFGGRACSRRRRRSLAATPLNPRLLIYGAEYSRSHHRGIDGTLYIIL